MKMKLFFVLALILLGAVSVGCGPKAEAHVNQPTHFVCWQNGVKIVDTTTLDGARYTHIDTGGVAVWAWVWEEADGVHTQTEAENLTCNPVPVR